MEKMGRLAGLTSALVAYRKSLEEQEKRLEKRTREILVRGGGDAQNYFLDCAHGCHQLAWEEAIDNVLDILTSGGSTCGPLSANELQRAAEYLSTVNALPLKKILDVHDSVGKGSFLCC